MLDGGGANRNQGGARRQNNASSGHDNNPKNSDFISGSNNDMNFINGSAANGARL